MAVVREPLRVREAHFHELDRLAHLAVEHVPQIDPFAEKNALVEANYRQDFEKPGVRVWVAESGGRLAGMVVTSEEKHGLFSRKMHVGGMATFPPFRGSNAADRLMRHGLTHARERNVRLIRFEAAPYMAIKYAAFFKRNGLKLVQTHALLYGIRAYEAHFPNRIVAWFMKLLKRPASK